jgi:hypothetical protein
MNKILQHSSDESDLHKLYIPIKSNALLTAKEKDKSIDSDSEWVSLDSNNELDYNVFLEPQTFKLSDSKTYYTGFRKIRHYVLPSLLRQIDENNSEIYSDIMAHNASEEHEDAVRGYKPLESTRNSLLNSVMYKLVTDELILENPYKRLLVTYETKSESQGPLTIDEFLETAGYYYLRYAINKRFDDLINFCNRMHQVDKRPFYYDYLICKILQPKKCSVQTIRLMADCYDCIKPFLNFEEDVEERIDLLCTISEKCLRKNVVLQAYRYAVRARSCDLSNLRALKCMLQCLTSFLDHEYLFNEIKSIKGNCAEHKSKLSLPVLLDIS